MTNPTDNLRRRLGGAALVAGPAFLLAGALVHPREVSDAHDQLAIVAGGLSRWYVAHLLYLLAAVVLLPAVLALGRRLRERAPRLELWGTGLAAVGLFSTAGLVALEGVGGWQLAQVGDRQGAAEAFDHLTHSAGVVVPFGIVGLTLSAGLIVLAIGLVRTSEAPAWMAWTIGAGAALLAVGLGAELHPAFLGGVAALAVGLAATGLDDLGLTTSRHTLGLPAGAPLAANR